MAIIPARGGSKRIPGKNIKLFNGKPIIAYSLEAAHASGLFRHVMVSTDCPQIAETARQYGAEVPFLRPAHLADDFTGTDAVVLHALEWYAQQNEIHDHVCCLYATAPLLSAENLQRGYERLVGSDAISCFSVTEYNYPILRSLKCNDDGYLAMFWPEYFETRSQDLPVAYHDAAQFYWAVVKDYVRAKRFISSRSLPLVLSRQMVMDIDTPEDWLLAETMHRVMQQTRQEG